MREEIRDAVEIAIIVAVLWTSSGTSWWWYVVLPLCGILVALKTLNLVMAVAIRIAEKRNACDTADRPDHDRG